jgi:hypothetical protein
LESVGSAASKGVRGLDGTAKRRFGQKVEIRDLWKLE